jgi:hypothetical protein
METSVYLAKLIGPLMALMGLFVVLHPAHLSKIAQGVLDSPALMFVSSVLALTSGLALVLSHTVITCDWRLIITVIGWITLLAGAARLLLPGLMQTIGTGMLDNRILTLVPGILLLGLGLTLAYIGYLG